MVYAPFFLFDFCLLPKKSQILYHQKEKKEKRQIGKKIIKKLTNRHNKNYEMLFDS
jgi:hypothetical protein